MISTLKINNLFKNYKKEKILDNITFNINKNEIVGIIGNNGSGKTTLMKCILKLTKIDSGEILINNINIKNQFVFKNVSSIIENPKLYGYMTGYENLYSYSLLYNNEYEYNIVTLSKELGLYDSLDKKVKNYSLGMKQRLAIIQALLNNPTLLILDEPMNGLDPQCSYELKQYLKKLSNKTSILISSHILSDIEYLCDKIFLLRNGKLVSLDLNYNKENFIIFETSDSKKSMDVFKKFYIPEVNYVDRNILSVKLNKEEIPTYVKELVSNNINIYSVCINKNSLEERYAKLLKGALQNVD